MVRSRAAASFCFLLRSFADASGSCVDLAGEMLPQDVEDNVRLIHESVMLEVQLIDDLLDLTKISRYTTPLPPPQPSSAPACDSFSPLLTTGWGAGRRRNKLKLNLRPVTLHEILSRTVQIVAHDISAKKLVVMRDFQATNDLLVGDPARCAALSVSCPCAPGQTRAT